MQRTANEVVPASGILSGIARRFAFVRMDAFARLKALAMAFALLIPGLHAASLPADAAELVMFERRGCPYCARWNQEVGTVYDKTTEGQRAPLRRASLDAPLPAELRLKPDVFYSPTFVLMDQGREIGRITGYAGTDAFWGLLGQMIGRLDRKAP